MAMQVKRIKELVNDGTIIVHDKSKGFTIRDLCEGFTSGDDGYTIDSVFAYNNKLNIRPSFQRNSVYNSEKRDSVIQTILNECPLNIMYWVDKEDGTYEILDGQQRTLAICNYVAGNFSVKSEKFPQSVPQQDFPNLQMNLTDLANQILDYELDIYVCKGTPTEKLKWFHVINTAGEELKEQELRNSSYTGKWLSSAKGYFSSSKGRGVNLAEINPNNNASEPLLSGDWNRQDYLETAINWAGIQENISIEKYMLDHRGDDDASELWQTFSKILEWVRGKFISYNNALKTFNWGEIYKKYNDGILNGNIISKNASEIHEEIIRLTSDNEVEATMKGIYNYIIWGDGKYLQLRQFDEKIARKIYEEQKHRCPYCVKEGNNREYAFKEMHADHIKPWSKGGITDEKNCQMLCASHNESKGNKW